MTPHEAIKNNLEKLPDLTCINGAMYFGAVETPCSGRETGECGSRCQNEQTYDEAMKELVEHIKSSQLSLLLSVKEMVESTKHKNLQAMEKGSEFMTPRMYRALGHNQALSDLQSLLDEEISKIHSI